MLHLNNDYLPVLFFVVAETIVVYSERNLERQLPSEKIDLLFIQQGQIRPTNLYRRYCPWMLIFIIFVGFFQETVVMWYSSWPLLKSVRWPIVVNLLLHLVSGVELSHWQSYHIFFLDSDLQFNIRTNCKEITRTKRRCGMEIQSACLIPRYSLCQSIIDLTHPNVLIVPDELWSWSVICLKCNFMWK